MKLLWTTDHYVLIQQWTTSTTPGLVAAMLLSCLLAVGYEYLRRFLSWWSRRKDLKKRHPIIVPLCQSVVYLMSVFISNVLMLMIMTYNIWIFVCVLLGAGIGFFFLPATSMGETDATHAQYTVLEISGECEPESTVYSSLPQRRVEEEEPRRESSHGGLGGYVSQLDEIKHDCHTGRVGVSKYCHGVEENKHNLIYDDDITTILELAPFKLTPELSTPI